MHVVSGAPQRGAGEARTGVLRSKTLAEAEFTSAEHVDKKGPRSAGGAGRQNPVYITTVWGYGYKWGF